MKKRGEKERVISVRGILTPAGWDEKGNVTKLSISTFDEREYVLELEESTRGLFSALRREAQLMGEVILVDKEKRLRVLDFFVNPAPGRERKG